MTRAGERTVSDAGEARLIELIKRAVDRSRCGDIASLGDDAAILPRRRAGIGPEVVSTDLLVEGTHWRPHHLSPSALGRRALVVNLSDLAAMAARPRWFTLGLGMPPAQPLVWFRGLLRGLIQAADEFDCPLVGGDLVRAPVATISITVHGECVTRRACRRDVARPGETLCVTGDLGRARLALDLLESDAPPPRSSVILRRHRRPQPRLREAVALAEDGAVRAMMDLSDGLLGDLDSLCRLSRVGAEVDLETLPLHIAARRLFAAQGEEPALGALTSGEEFELLFTTRMKIDAIRLALRRRGIKTRITPIGRIVKRRGIEWRRGGRAVTVSGASAFAHFSQGKGPGRT